MNSVENSLIQAIHAHQQGNLVYAEQCYEKSLETQATCMQAMHGLGLLAAEKQEWNNAILWIKKALDITPDSACLHLHLANALKHNGQIEPALSHYQTALCLDPQYAEAHNNYALLLFKQHRIPEARQHYEQAIRLKSDYLDAHFNLGLLLLAQGENPAAINQFKHVLSLDPYSISTHRQLSALYWQCGQLEKVNLHYKILLKLLPNSAELLNNLGALALKQVHIDQAIDYFKQALGVEPQHKTARINLATSLLQKNSFKESIWHYSLYLNLEPDDPEALYNRANGFMLTGQLDKAIQDLKKIIELDAKHINAYCNLAAIYLKLEDKKAAIHIYQLILTLQKNHPIACYMLSALTQRATVPEKPPIEYIKNLFNNYALHFDAHLTEILHYKTPELLYEQITPLLENKKNNVLDLGCGTGLSGIPFKEIAVKLTGVDISSNMLAQARSKNCYDKLIESDISSALSALTETYDLILCIDTLVYFGELDSLFSQIAARLKAAGLFAFSIELASNSTNSYHLQTTGRYQHANTYIEKLAKKNNLSCLKQGSVAGRYQANDIVNTTLFVLKKAIDE